MKDTKDTPLPITNKPSQPWGRKPFTEEASQECASTSHSEHRKGQLSEQTALQFFIKRNFHLFSRNQKVGGVEVDLIFKKEHWLLVEVKTLRYSENIGFRLSSKQRQRLLHAREVWQSRWGEPVQLLLALVFKGDVIVVPFEEI